MNLIRPLDHLVHRVMDLDAAGEAYARLGFTVGVRNRHPWGTHNRIIQFPGFFIEILEVAEPEKIVDPAPGAFSFGAFNRDWPHDEGGSMLVLEGRAGDAEAFRAAGIGDFAPFDFARKGERPDGSPVDVAFTLCFARDEVSPETGFFTCRQHFPENFWSAAAQQHGNGVSGIAGVVLVADNPSDHHVFLKAFTGAGDLVATSAGIRIATAHGEIQVVDPVAAKALYGIEPMAGSGLRIAALRLKAQKSTRAHLHGLVLVFEPQGAAA